MAVYQPFAQVVQLLKYASHPDPRIRMAILSGPLIVGWLAALRPWESSPLPTFGGPGSSEDAEDLHGSARLATADDVKETGFLTTQHGVYVGGWYDETEHRLQYLRDNGPSHVLAFAPTRSGKGVSLVIPSLLILARELRRL